MPKNLTNALIDTTYRFDAIRDVSICEKLGAEAFAAALAAEDYAADELSADDEWARLDYRERLDEHDDRARELFGNIGGYYLGWVEDGSIGLSTQPNTAETRGPLLEHTALTASIDDGKLSIKKTRFNGMVRTAQEVTELDRQTITEALTQIRGVTNILTNA